MWLPITLAMVCSAHALPQYLTSSIESLTNSISDFSPHAHCVVQYTATGIQSPNGDLTEYSACPSSHPHTKNRTEALPFTLAFITISAKEMVFCDYCNTIYDYPVHYHRTGMTCSQLRVYTLDRIKNFHTEYPNIAQWNYTVCQLYFPSPLLLALLHSPICFACPVTLTYSFTLTYSLLPALLHLPSRDYRISC